jgi:hypothetical protein
MQLTPNGVWREARVGLWVQSCNWNAFKKKERWELKQKYKLVILHQVPPDQARPPTCVWKPVDPKQPIRWHRPMPRSIFYPCTLWFLKSLILKVQEKGSIVIHKIHTQKLLQFHAVPWQDVFPLAICAYTRDYQKRLRCMDPIRCW